MYSYDPYSKDDIMESVKKYKSNVMKDKLNQLGLIGPTYDPQFNNFLRNHKKDIKYGAINNLYNLDKFKKNLRIIKNTDNIYKTANKAT